jgi:hypothetical protein
MPGPKPEIEGTSIVLVGQFNPPIFQPAWLAAQKLLRPEDAEAAVVEVIHPQVARFTAEWVMLEVSQNRFSAETTDPACYETLRDLVTGIFTVLEHTPFSQMGFNSTMHFALQTVERWHSLGHLLAPKEPWSAILEKPGTRSLTVQGKRAGAASERVSITVEPSLRVSHGAFINVNEHFQRAPGPDAARELLALLASEWSGALAYASSAANHLLGQVSTS